MYILKQFQTCIRLFKKEIFTFNKFKTGSSDMRDRYVNTTKPDYVIHEMK